MDAEKAWLIFSETALYEVCTVLSETQYASRHLLSDKKFAIKWCSDSNYLGWLLFSILFIFSLSFYAHCNRKSLLLDPHFTGSIPKISPRFLPQQQGGRVIILWMFLRKLLCKVTEGRWAGSHTYPLWSGFLQLFSCTSASWQLRWHNSGKTSHFSISTVLWDFRSKLRAGRSLQVLLKPRICTHFKKFSGAGRKQLPSSKQLYSFPGKLSNIKSEK